jgi:hypothetical protein
VADGYLAIDPAAGLSFPMVRMPAEENLRPASDNLTAKHLKLREIDPLGIVIKTS